MRLTRLLLENWRNVQKVDVAFREWMFIVGANASGKSNLLDAFRFCETSRMPVGDFSRRFKAAAEGHGSIRSTHAAVQTLLSTSRSTSMVRTGVAVAPAS